MHMHMFARMYSHATRASVSNADSMRAALPGELLGLSVDASHVYVVDDDEHCVWRLDRTGRCGLIEARSAMRGSWMAGSDSPPSQARDR